MNDLGVMQPEGRSRFLAKGSVRISLHGKGETAFPPCFPPFLLGSILKFDLAYHFENDRHLMG